MSTPRFIASLCPVVLLLAATGTILGQTQFGVPDKPASSSSTATVKEPAELDPEALKNLKKVAGFNPDSALGKYVLNFDTPNDPELQRFIGEFDYELRGKYEIETGTAVGLLDLKTFRVAMINPDEADYSPSVPKPGVLLTYFQFHPEASTNLAGKVRSDLQEIAKSSNYELTSLYSQTLGLKNIQAVLSGHGLYDREHGGLWVGKHYGLNEEVYQDPRNGLSHAGTVRQFLRYFLLLEQGRLVSPEASRVLRALYESPELPHNDLKFVKALHGRDVQIIRNWGAWQTYQMDSAVITGNNRHYILVVIANHLDGDGYIRDMAVRVDNLMKDGTSE